MNSKKEKQQIILSATAKTTVRFNDCDPLGIVWHANYLNYFEDGREAFSKKYNFDFHDFYDMGLAVPFIHASVDYKKTLTFREVILIEVSYEYTPASKIIFNYTIRKEASNEIVCTGKTIQVFIEKNSKELYMIVPDFIKKWLKEVGLE